MPVHAPLECVHLLSSVEKGCGGSGLSVVMQRTAMLKYHVSSDHGMGRCNLVADGSTAVELTADESAGVDGAINGMKLPCVGSVPSTRFGDWKRQKNNWVGYDMIGNIDEVT